MASLEIHRAIQIAGVLDLDEGELLLRSGTDLVGFPLHLAYHPQEISDAAAARIISALSSPEAAVLITYADSCRELLELVRNTGISKVQVHSEMPIAELNAFRSEAPGILLVKSLIVGREGLAALRASVRRFSPFCDAFILDTYDPSTGACGATGMTHDWNVSRSLVEVSPRPVILAGGLTPANVGDAIRCVRPCGVDAHTGLEDQNGRKDPGLVRKFIKEARSAFAETEEA